MRFFFDEVPECRGRLGLFVWADGEAMRGEAKRRGLCFCRLRLVSPLREAERKPIMCGTVWLVVPLEAPLRQCDRFSISHLTRA